jgi:hypothetical protein
MPLTAAGMIHQSYFFRDRMQGKHNRNSYYESYEYGWQECFDNPSSS